MGEREASGSEGKPRGGRRGRQGSGGVGERSGTRGQVGCEGKGREVKAGQVGAERREREITRCELEGTVTGLDASLGTGLQANWI